MKAQEVLRNVELMIARAKEHNNRYYISDVYEGLGIFDWWNEYLSVSQLKDMRKFLREAIKLGYEGYVCFKVGAKGCSNGMWAHKADSTDGYSPDGEALYKSFVNEYNYWSVCDNNEKWFPEGNDYNSLHTIKDLEQMITEL